MNALPAAVVGAALMIVAVATAGRGVSAYAAPIWFHLSTGLSDARQPDASQTTGGGRSADTPIDDVTAITGSTDKFALVGRPVRFQRVKVQRVAGIRSFWAGDTRTTRVFVVVDAINLQQAIGSDRGLKDGDLVAIDGTIDRVPGALGKVTVTSWGRLDDKDAKLLSERDVYVYAKQVKMLAR